MTNPLLLRTIFLTFMFINFMACQPDRESDDAGSKNNQSMIESKPDDSSDDEERILCTSNIDCDTGFCELFTSTCQEPSCTDGQMNGDEEAVDCGGSCEACASCEDGVLNQSEVDIDCGGPCAPCGTCDDGLMNGLETGIDCGGRCGACPPTCDDGLQNQNEEGIDCGGSCRFACPSCDDLLQNQDEEGVDCGGGCEACLDNNPLICDVELLSIDDEIVEASRAKYLVGRASRLQFKFNGIGDEMLFDDYRVRTKIIRTPTSNHIEDTIILFDREENDNAIMRWEAGSTVHVAEGLGIILLPNENYAFHFVVEDDNGQRSENECRVDIKSVVTERLFMQVTWDSTTDLDQHVSLLTNDGFCVNSADPVANDFAEPCGIDAGQLNCYYGNCRCDAFFQNSLDWDASGAESSGDICMDRDMTLGFGPEWSSIATPSYGQSYLIGYEMFVGSTNASSSIYIDGELAFEQDLELNDGDWHETAIVFWPDDENGTPCIEDLSTTKQECPQYQSRLNTLQDEPDVCESNDGPSQEGEVCSTCEDCRNGLDCDVSGSPLLSPRGECRVPCGQICGDVTSDCCPSNYTCTVIIDLERDERPRFCLPK